MSIGLRIEAGFFGLYKIESLADENTCNRYTTKTGWTTNIFGGRSGCQKDALKDK